MISVILSILGILFMLVEMPRGIIIPDPKRMYNTLLGAVLIYSGLKLRSDVNLRLFIPLTLASFFFTPLLLLSFILKAPKSALSNEEGEKDITGLLEASFSSCLVICDSTKLASSVAISIAGELAKYRRVVLVDWGGEARNRLERTGVEFRVAKAGEIWYGYAGGLGPSYYMTLSDLISYFTGINASVISEVLRSGDISLLEDLKIPEPSRSLLIKVFGEEKTLLHEALPETAGVLVIDASRLPARGKDIISIMTLLQATAYERRDFLVVAPLLSPLTDPRSPSAVQDEMRWLISSLSRGGAFISSVREGERYAGEFDLALECDSCRDPLSKLDSYRLCLLQVRRGWIRP